MLATLLPWLMFLAIGAAIFLFGHALLRSRRSTTAGGEGNLVFGRLTIPLAALIPHSSRTKQTLGRELRQAGHYRPLALQEFLSIRNGLVIGWTILTVAALVAAARPVDDPTPRIVLAGACGLAILSASPRLWLRSAAARRVRQLQMGFPAALDLVTLCLSGGLPLQQSLRRVAKELRTFHPDLALELDIFRRQAESHTLEHALVQFVKRTAAAEMRMLTFPASETEWLETNGAGSLREFAEGLRRNYHRRAKERGNKTSGKWLLAVVLCLASPVCILLFAPAIFELRQFMARENGGGGILAPPIDLASPLEAVPGTTSSPDAATPE